MLAEGLYPPRLKRRVGGDWGHLANIQASVLLRRLGLDGLQRIVCSHLSEHNNRPELVVETLTPLLDGDESRLMVAAQDDSLAWQELYAGKAKSVHATDDPDLLVLTFRDDTSAFDGERMESLARKGMVNNTFNAYIMETLQAAGIPTHFEKRLSGTESLVKKLEMIPVECVVRNIAAGGLVKRLGVEEGQALSPPTFELFLKDDAKHDPMINESLAETFGWATPEQLAEMKALTFQVNEVLKALFEEGGLLLVDYKLEFGLFKGQILLGDEFSPDGCRLWDAKTREKLDKDRFRQGLGGVIEAYEEVGRRIGVRFD
jgi:phosphoribosylaminoimidazole-succinocarboxamide synthase